MQWRGNREWARTGGLWAGQILSLNALQRYAAFCKASRGDNSMYRTIPYGLPSPEPVSFSPSESPPPPPPPVRQPFSQAQPSANARLARSPKKFPKRSPMPGHKVGSNDAHRRDAWYFQEANSSRTDQLENRVAQLFDFRLVNPELHKLKAFFLKVERGKYLLFAKRSDIEMVEDG